MGSPRQCPLVSAVDCKIYVFGGTYSGQFSAEVFDPKKNQWEPLPGLHFDGEGRPVAPINIVMADDDSSNKRILLHISHTDQLCAYCVDSKSWCCLDPRFGVNNSIAFDIGTSAVVDDILYCYYYSKRRFVGYDLINKTWFPVDNILGADKFGLGRISMFSLGGNTFCFLHSATYYEDLSDRNTMGIRIRYIKFKIEREEKQLCFGKFPLTVSEPSVTASGQWVTKWFFRRFTIPPLELSTSGPRVSKEFCSRIFLKGGINFECCVTF